MVEVKTDSWLKKLSVPLFAVLCGFLGGAVIMLIFGYNPILAYSEVSTGVLASPYYIGEALAQATLLIFTGLAFDVANKDGIVNIVIARQLLAGRLRASEV